MGSNTTRLLVGEMAKGRLDVLAHERVFTLIGSDVAATGAISDGKLAEVAAVVADQATRARTLGAETVAVVATAAIRSAANGRSLATAVESSCGLELRVLDPQEEARLSFAGATHGEEEGEGPVAVVDVGGGSTEVVVGHVGGALVWCESYPVGSATLTAAHVRSDPPAAADLAALREHAAATLDGISAPSVVRGLAVGGSATSLRRLVGARLDRRSLRHALATLTALDAATAAERLELALERVRLLPAGIVLLEEAGTRLGAPLQVAFGGLREGVVLDLARGASRPS